MAVCSLAIAGVLAAAPSRAALLAALDTCRAGGLTQAAKWSS